MVISEYVIQTRLPGRGANGTNTPLTADNNPLSDRYRHGVVHVTTTRGPREFLADAAPSVQDSFQ